jgi:Restriction endonuclease
MVSATQADIYEDITVMKRKRSKVSKDRWREFEELVTRIEAALCPKGAIVKSPDKLVDYVTQQLREVDASIRYKVGTTEILIIIECRERRKIEDAMWIEQLASKQRHVGAAKCIAVTSSIFTKPAVKKARHYGIELRHVKRIDEETIIKWAPIRTWFYNYKLIDVDLGFAHDGKIEVNQQLYGSYTKKWMSNQSKMMAAKELVMNGVAACSVKKITRKRVGGIKTAGRNCLNVSVTMP